jgi:hypothetical protein
MVAVTTHEKALRKMRCVVSHSPFITLHHCHGGSIKLDGWHVGMGQKQNPFLQIPLNEKYHTGLMGIDSGYGVVSWEAVFGTQVEHLEWVNEQLEYDIYAEAIKWQNKHRAKVRNMVTRRLGKVIEFSTAKERETDS